MIREDQRGSENPLILKPDCKKNEKQYFMGYLKYLQFFWFEYLSVLYFAI